MTLLPLLFAVGLSEGDIVLAERLKRRDPQALAELYDRYGRLVYALIFRIVRDTGVAEDLVQETFLRVWNRAQGFDAQKGALGPWLLAVARNRAIDYLRSTTGRMRSALELEETEHPTLFVDVEKDLLNSDRVRRVRDAFQKLSPNQREVIELAYFEGLSQTEMAEKMGQPLGTVKTWVRTALQILRDELGAVVPSMSCDELRDDYELYALGVLEDPERAEIREHLGRGCEVCTGGVRQAREIMAMLAETTAPLAPSPRLRRRILASVGVENSRWWTVPLWAGISLCFLVAAVYFYERQQAGGREIARVREQYREQSVEVTRLSEASTRLNGILSLLNQPETKQVTFGAGAPAPPRGKVFVNPNQGVLLLASHLPPAPAGKTYEMWIIPKSGKPVPAGLFQSGADGTATHLQSGPVNVAATGAVAVTLEPAGGVPAPTSTPLIVAAL